MLWRPVFLVLTAAAELALFSLTALLKLVLPLYFYVLLLLFPEPLTCFVFCSFRISLRVIRSDAVTFYRRQACPGLHAARDGKHVDRATRECNLAKFELGSEGVLYCCCGEA
jgi:hypothetical protein